MYSTISSKIYIVKKIVSGLIFLAGEDLTRRTLTKICRSATWLRQQPASITALSPGFRNAL
jgi:hypothetical protein